MSHGKNEVSLSVWRLTYCDWRARQPGETTEAAQCTHKNILGHKNETILVDKTTLRFTYKIKLATTSRNSKQTKHILIGNSKDIKYYSYPKVIKYPWKIHKKGAFS